MVSFKLVIGAAAALFAVASAAPSNLKRQGDIIVPVDADVPVNVNLKRDIDVDVLVNVDLRDIVVPVDADVDVDVDLRDDIDVLLDADVLANIDILKKRCPSGGCTEGSEPTSIAAIIANVNAELGSIVADIEAAIAVSAGVSAKVDIKVVLALLVKIQVLLAAALADIKVCINVNGMLSLTGAVLSAVQLCALVGGLVNTVLQVLVVVIRGCGGIHVDLQVCISAIIALCADILSVCIVALPAVKVLLAALLKAVCLTLGSLGAQIVVLTECLSL